MNTLKITSLSLLMAILCFVNVKAQNKGLNQSVNTVITDYLALKDALVASNGNTASAKAKVLLTALSDVKGLNPDQSAIITKLQYDSRHISEVNKIAHQREHFASLSNNLYTLVKKLKVNQVTLYRQYCTMNKATFLSESDKGKDPYMGMECSKVSETLAAVKK